jgi:nitrite reductase (NO-forming)
MDKRRAGRATERVVAATAMILAASFLALALIAVLAGNGVLGPWLPVHLLLAGAATTAVAGVVPFFSAALTNGPPAPGWLRLGAVIGVALGTTLVVGGRIASPALVGGNAWFAGVGGVVFIGGLVLAAGATLLPLRYALGRRRVVIGFIYGMALINVVAGATLASLLLLGWLPAVQDWPALKPAHAWLNVFGFVSLVIAGTLLHLLPAVVGARISDSRVSLVTYVCVAIGPPVAALGFIVGSDPVALTGAVVLVVGALGLSVYALDVVRHSARWTTDPAWHRFTAWSLLAAIAWFVAGSVIAAWLVLANGSDPLGWQLAPLVAPLFVGWIAQALVGAWSHLVPAVGPGLPPRHAMQRRVLGMAATARVVLLNGGAALMLAGQLFNVAPLVAAGGLGVVGAGLAALSLVAASQLKAADPESASG